jgi:uncharacterized membrane protein
MKYLESLKKRELSVENLPKTLQKKIKDLDYQINTLKEVEENSKNDFTESDLADIEVIKGNISELDKHIAHKVNIFDQAKYDDKLAKINKMSKIKQGIKEVEELQEQEVKEPEVEEPVVAKVVAIESEPKQAPVQSEYTKPASIEPKANVAPPPPPPPAPIYEEEQVEDDFERQGDGNPKKMTTGLILMGVGAFFLTWGAVNFFKSRR